MGQPSGGLLTGCVFSAGEAGSGTVQWGRRVAAWAGDCGNGGVDNWARGTKGNRAARARVAGTGRRGGERGEERGGREVAEAEGGRVLGAAGTVVGCVLQLGHAELTPGSRSGAGGPSTCYKEPGARCVRRYNCRAASRGETAVREASAGP